MKNTDSFEALLAEYGQADKGSSTVDANVGDRVKGTVVAIDDQTILVDLGGKVEGVMERDTLTDDDGKLTVAVGDPIEAAVTSISGDSGTLMLGTQHARQVRGTAELEQAYQQQLPVEGKVTAKIKGGVEVQIGGQRAFCPASQIDTRFVEDLEEFVGQQLEFRITKFEGGQRVNMVVSRRALLEEAQQAQAEVLRATLEEGAILTGTVTSLKEFGAFVDLGGLQGMIHISELSYQRVEHPSEILSEGQQVEVSVLRIEKTDNPKRPEKIALSMRALAQDPWMEVRDQFPAGSKAKGTVTRLQPFGAFVEIAPGIEGLVHVSELGAGKRVAHPQEVLSPGQQVEATVLNVDLAAKRISLTLDEERAMEAAPDIAAYSDGPDSVEEGGIGSFGLLLQQSMKNKK
jgi:small subunit ribosomal protein S1